MLIIPIGEHELLVFWVQFVTLLVVARLLGSLMLKVGQPSVIGEIGAGVLLGPSVLGALWPEGASWLFPPPPTQSAMLLVVLNTRSYTVVVIMAIATSMAAPPLLHTITRRWQGSPEERERLEQEETLRSNLLVRPEHVLVPVERPAKSLLAAKVLDIAWPQGLSATVLGVGTAGDAAIRPTVEVFGRRKVERVEVLSGDPAAAVLEQVRLGYGAIGIGAHEGEDEGRFMSALTDRLLMDAELPVVVVVRSGEYARLDAMVGFSRILVPVVGTVPDRLAQEVGFSVAANGGAELVIAHVAPPLPDDLSPGQAGAARATGVAGSRLAVQARPTLSAPDLLAEELAGQVVADAADLAARLGATPRTVVRHAVSPAAEIVALIGELEPDLVVLGTELRPGPPGRPFLGHLVEQVLAQAEANVAVVVAPPSWVASRARS
ncbi:MAG: universal stress protein [Actinomycetota bacterium]|nr:universal stress protein [Actinomycetota bacterium]